MKYSEFKRIFAKHDWANKWYKAIPIWFFGNIILGLTILMLLRYINNAPKEKYPSEKYRKVVKEGLFWDSIEYHER